jgi:outer membrane murein-binding lipoprotein Lpp
VWRKTSLPAGLADFVIWRDNQDAMESNGAPVWAQELRAFTEFSLGKLEQRLTASIATMDERSRLRTNSLETRLTRKIENMDVRIQDKLDVLSSDVAVLKTDVAVLKTDVAVLKTDVAVLKTDVHEVKLRVAAVESRLA